MTELMLKASRASQSVARLKCLLSTALRHVHIAQKIGWPALEQSWHRDVDRLKTMLEEAMEKRRR